ncbi:MAG: Methyltransferase FkbM [Massilia sp.]|nr:Methyltransferase FkbM [Massilia sp.]
MKLISYAQNFEDVLLWRALGHVQGGFYIDAGANDPVDHSVTKAFYDAGWHGINIEPLAAFQQLFQAQRPRDINLAVAAGAEEGSLTLYDVPAVNGWASPDRAVAEAHRAEGYVVSEVTVPVRTLASICAEHVTGDIHFLKIDVEGFEGEVLRGMDFGRWRPWILVVEATMPNSRETNHASWEPLVTAHDYDFAWFDGLNRYYVAREHAQLGAALSIQPNVFDNFISHHLERAWADQKSAAAQAVVEREAAAAAALVRDEALRHIEELTAKSQDLALALHEAKFNAERVAVWARELESTLKATLHSTSWRVTRPLRSVGALVRLVRRGALLRALVTRVTGNERMRRLLLPVLLRFPWIARRVSVALAGIKHSTPDAGSAEAQLPDHIRALPVSARKVLADLKQARRHHPPGA